MPGVPNACGCCGGSGCTIYKTLFSSDVLSQFFVPSGAGPFDWAISGGFLSVTDDGATLFIDESNPDATFSGTVTIKARADTLGATVTVFGNHNGANGGFAAGLYASLTFNGASSVIEMGVNNGGVLTTLGTPKTFTADLDTLYELKLCWHTRESSPYATVVCKVNNTVGCSASAESIGVGPYAGVGATPNGGQVDIDEITFAYHPEAQPQCPSCSATHNPDGSETEQEESCVENCRDGRMPSTIAVILDGWEAAGDVEELGVCRDCEDWNGTWILDWASDGLPHTTSLCLFEEAGVNCGGWYYFENRIFCNEISPPADECYLPGIGVEVAIGPDDQLYLVGTVYGNSVCTGVACCYAVWAYQRVYGPSPEGIDCFAAMSGELEYTCSTNTPGPAGSSFPPFTADDYCIHGTFRLSL